MAATAVHPGEALGGDEYLDYLEEARRDVLGGRAFRERKRGETKEEIAASKRRKHVGGDANHRFEGERYLNCTHKGVRRGQLRKLVDEGGQISVGGPMPSHPVLDKWHSIEFGLTEEEILELEKQDANPQSLIVNGWWVWLQRHAHWSVAIGSCLVGEGEKRLPEVKVRYMREVDEMREEYAEMDINVERALTLTMEHSPVGADAEHSVFGANVVRQHVNTPELQEELRKAFVLTVQGRGSHSF